jgi:transcriptional regulator with XRE-family HTH domain
MTISELVSRNLRATRIRRKLSQEELARRTGISVSYVSMLERGERSPPLDRLEALAKALKVPPLDLLARTTRG